VNTKVLFVDDDDNVLSAVLRNFRKRYEVDTASGGLQGLRAMEDHGPYAVVVADMAMPGMNGIEFLKRAQVLAPDTIRIMFTGHPGPVTMLEAINNGQVFRFISKPCKPEELALAVDAGVRQHRMITAERELLEATLTGSIAAMTGMLEVLDPALFSTARSLADRASWVARAMGAQDAWSITLAALFAPLWILPLSGELRRKAAAEGMGDPALAPAQDKAANIVQPIPRLEGVAQIIRHLGTGFDGSGASALALKGEALPLGSRILRALLDFSAIEGRVKSMDVALEELRLQGGRYDPKVLSALAAALNLQMHTH